MDGKQLVIVESPSKARNINQYLGTDYVVMASVGHVRDLPSKAPKGEKQPVPGVDLENNFEPTYEILPGKKSTINDLKRLAGHAREVWFATDLDREGEAIAWHLAQEMGIPAEQSKRVVFNAVTKSEIERAFQHPHPIDVDRVNAQQARRILDRIVGYQVSPLLWRKVARGLSAGRVQSVAVRLIVEREREIQAFIPDEYWTISGSFAIDSDQVSSLAQAWQEFVASDQGTAKNGKGNQPTVKAQNAWLADHHSFRAELFQLDGSKPELATADRACEVADRIGLVIEKRVETEVPGGKGPAATRVVLVGHCKPGTEYTVGAIETKRTTSRPPAPFITSTLQQAASTRIGFAARRTMRTAQQLYEGVDIPGRGTVGLITYMRTDSTHLSKEAIDSVRSYIGQQFGDDYLPTSANSYTSSNKKAQEAHEAIRPTDVSLHPDAVASGLKPDQAKLYRLIWSRYVACQMVNAKWDLTSILLSPTDDRQVVFRTTGRRLVFDGFYKVAGVPTFADEQVLPQVAEHQTVAPFALDPVQKFTSPPARYTEASLVKTLEEEGIGRPSTYAEIIQKIQDRKYVEQRERRFFATDLGEVVTDKLIEAFPDILNVGFTRDMEDELDRVESRELDWTEVLRHFYGPFSARLAEAHESLSHAKAETQPAPHTCEKCGATTVYRFGKNGRFLSCSRYPDCDYASPIDRDGNPAKAELVDVACLKCGGPMQKRSGRFGPFLGCNKYPECDGIIKLDRKGQPVAPQPPALETDQECPKCSEPLYLRAGARGPWLSCSAFPKCRGRGAWSKLDKDVKDRLQAMLDEHMKQHPIPIICDMKGKALTDERGKPIPDPEEPGAPVIPAPLLQDDDGADAPQPNDEKAAMNAGAA
ncbi:MAG: type I DNA topoisomerase [Planctomycetes bacterium]|nr:type I DNA topoisomerase [Planctomycetota bacterium]